MPRFFTRERLMLGAIILGSCIGIWHALPMVNVVADETYYISGVLHAIEAKSVLPQGGDVPYGTLTFYLDYVLQILLLAGLLAWKSFSVVALKTFIILNPAVHYIAPRFGSALIVSIFAWFYNRFLREEGMPLLQRAATLGMLFCTILTAVMLHTGKQWVLSMSLAMSSILFLYSALVWRVSEPARAVRAGIWSILLMFLASANFLLMGFFLVNVPVLLYMFWGERLLRRHILQATTVGMGILLFVFLINYQGFINDVVGFFRVFHPLPFMQSTIPQVGFLQAIRLHGWQLFQTFPTALFLLTIAVVYNAIRNKTLFYISIGYTLLYFGLLAIIATWSENQSEYLHIFIPYGFFFSGMLASFDYKKMRPFLCGFLGIQAVVYVYVLYLLVVPTTFNLMRNYIAQNFAQEHVLVYDDVPELSLPQNSESALLMQEQFCGQKCDYLRTTSNIERFVPVVVTYQSQLSALNTRAYTRILWISGKSLADTCAGKPLATFESGALDANYVSVEYNLGNYFLPDFWRLSRLGKNMYVYQVSKECLSQLPHKTS